MKLKDHQVKPDLQEDVSELLQSSVVAEATEKVEQSFSQAWEKLDPASRELLGAHFDGKPVKELGRELGLSESETEAWLKRAKRDLVQSLRAQFLVRQ